MTDTLGRMILSIIERLSSFRGENVLPLYRLVYCKVSFIQCPLYIRRSTVFPVIWISIGHEKSVLISEVS